MKREMGSQHSRPAEDLEPEDLLRLGECVRDLVNCLGYGTQASPMEAVLFREAISEAVYTLSLRQSMRSSLKESYEKRGMPLPESLPLEMSYLAQGILDQPFSDGRAISSTEQIARVKFALTLDPSCSDAYLMRGAVEEQKGHYLKAEEDYKRAVELAAEKLGPDAFLGETRRTGQIHFWYSDGTRPYMRARASLAYLLWQKLSRLPEAIAHFQEMLELNPGDNQGNRSALLCCLLEAGDDAALEQALARHRVYIDDVGQEYEISDTCWWYCNACWLFRCQPPSLAGDGANQATKALRKAFKYNKHVPRFLLHPEDLADLNNPGHYAPGDIYEAAWYVNFSLKGWQQTPGALAWLETTASQAKLMHSSKKKRK